MPCASWIFLLQMFSLASLPVGLPPFVLEGLAFARRRKCATILFSCSPGAAASVDADIKVIPLVGPEVITGSTRMKAGTATKLFLNMLSTATMVKMGKTFGNLMVDLKPWNAKLRDRSARILSTLANVEICRGGANPEEFGG